MFYSTHVYVFFSICLSVFFSFCPSGFFPHSLCLLSFILFSHVFFLFLSFCLSIKLLVLFLLKILGGVGGWVWSNLVNYIFFLNEPFPIRVKNIYFPDWVGGVFFSFTVSVPASVYNWPTLGKNNIKTISRSSKGKS